MPVPPDPETANKISLQRQRIEGAKTALALPCRPGYRPPILVSDPVAAEGEAMCRCLGKVCAALLIFSGVGCLDSFLSRQIVVYGPKVVVPGTVDEVAAKLKDGLNEAGILLNAKRVGSEYRIASQWKSGLVFCLHLSPKEGGKGNSTLVRMQWDRGGNEELWQLILKTLKAPDEEANAASAKAAE